MENIPHYIIFIIPVYTVISYAEQNFFSNKKYLLVESVDENIISLINLKKIKGKLFIISF